MRVVKELPEGVELSAHLRERAAGFLPLMANGLTYYVALTQDLMLLLEIGPDGKERPRDRRRRFGDFQKERALRDLLNSVQLQVRDVELAGVEQNVGDRLLKRMRELMSPTIRAGIEAELAQKALPSGDEKSQKKV